MVPCLFSMCPHVQTFASPLTALASAADYSGVIEIAGGPVYARATTTLTPSPIVGLTLGTGGHQIRSDRIRSC
jgi:hypothetical protein